MEFILKSRAFLLELFDYGINECVCHQSILSLVSRTSRWFVLEELVSGRKFPLLDEIPLRAGLSDRTCASHRTSIGGLSTEATERFRRLAVYFTRLSVFSTRVGSRGCRDLREGNAHCQLLRLMRALYG